MQHLFYLTHKNPEEKKMTYVKEDWKAERETTCNVLVKTLLSMHGLGDGLIKQVITKGIYRQFDEVYSTEEKKETFLNTAPGLTIEELFENTRPPKERIVQAIREKDIDFPVPNAVLLTMNLKQLNAILINL